MDFEEILAQVLTLVWTGGADVPAHTISCHAGRSSRSAGGR